jgi:hypothetical protein
MEDIFNYKELIYNSLTKKQGYYWCPFECGTKNKSKSCIIQHISRIKPCSKLAEKPKPLELNDNNPAVVSFD